MQLCLRPSSCSDKFGDGSVQSTTENFMPSYSLHTALCLMYQLWTAQPKTGRKANCDALHVSMCMSVCVFWGGNMNCSSYCSWVRARQEAHYSVSIHHDYLTFNNCLFTDQRRETLPGFCGDTQLWQDLFFFFLLFMLQIMLHMSSNYFWKCEITYVYWAKNSPTEINITSPAMQQTNPSKTNRFLNLHEKQAN